MFIDYKASFLRFVYPFLFDSDQFLALCEGVGQARWKGRKGLLQVWEQEDFPKDDLLAHVAEFLNPPRGVEPTARLWSMSTAALQSPNGGFGAGTNSTVSWELVTPRGDILFEISCVQLIFFRIGIGLVNIDAKPIRTQAEVSDWLNFLHYFRFSCGQRGVSLRARQRVGYDAERQEPSFTPFFPQAPQSSTADTDSSVHLQDLLQIILDSCTGTSGKWWNDVFVPGQLLPFAVLFPDDATDGEIPGMLYRIRNYFHARQTVHPTSNDLSMDHPALLPYARQQWFTYSLNGGGFVAFNAPKTDFFRITLPDHLKKTYFLLYLLALKQRFTLIMLSQEVATRWVEQKHSLKDGGYMENREDAFARIQDHLLFFMARGYYAQVMQTENHHRYYRKWHEIFQMEQLYEEVSDEIRYMHDFLQTQREKRTQEIEEANRSRVEKLERNLSLIAWIIGIPALLLTFLDVVGVDSFQVAVFTFAGGVVLGLLITVTIRLLTKRSESQQ